MTEKKFKINDRTVKILESLDGAKKSGKRVIYHIGNLALDRKVKIDGSNAEEVFNLESIVEKTHSLMLSGKAVAVQKILSFGYDIENLKINTEKQVYCYVLEFCECKKIDMSEIKETDLIKSENKK